MGAGVKKREQIAGMFDRIAGQYDFLNHFLSLGIDRKWRRGAIEMLRDVQPRLILDVACGTGDFAIESMRLNPDKITGVDISPGMLAMGRKKVGEKHLEKKIEFIETASEDLPFGDETFDAVTVAFGVRNFEDLDRGLREMHRVLKKGGRAVILEFSRPAAFPFKQVFGLYFRRVLPLIGRLISRDRTAYTYLPESVQSFPEGPEFLRVMERAGFRSPDSVRLTLGVCSIYTGEK